MNNSMLIDFHCHVLPGVDDGSDSLGTSVRMLRMAAQQNVGLIAATSHFYADRDHPEEFLKRRQAALERLRTVMEPDFPKLRPGAEVSYFPGMEGWSALRELRILGSNTLLLEMPFCRWNAGELRTVAEIQERQGLQVVLAHVERYASFQDRDTFPLLRREGVCFHANAGGFLRWQDRGRMLRLLRNNQIHVLGSDSHNITSRPPNLGQAMLYLQEKFGAETVKPLQKTAAELLSWNE